MPTPPLTDMLASLSGELCHALSLLSDALTVSGFAGITHISECHRRSTSLTADTVSHLFSVFCPSLERAPCICLCEKLCAAVGAVFEVGLLLPATPAPDTRRSTELQSLCHMGELLHRGVLTLPRYVKGSRHPSPPDTYRFHAEHTKARAAHALQVMHHDRTAADAAISHATGQLTLALCEAYTSLLVLVAHSV